MSHLPGNNRGVRGWGWYSLCVCVVSMTEWVTSSGGDKQEYLCKEVTALCLTVWCDTMQFHYIVFFWEQWKLNTGLWTEVGRENTKERLTSSLQWNLFFALYSILIFNLHAAKRWNTDEMWRLKMEYGVCIICKKLLTFVLMSGLDFSFSGCFCSLIPLSLGVLSCLSTLIILLMYACAKLEVLTWRFSSDVPVSTLEFLRPFPVVKLSQTAPP